jgi:hypothetical protein
MSATENTTMKKLSKSAEKRLERNRLLLAQAVCYEVHLERSDIVSKVKDIESLEEANVIAQDMNNQAGFGKRATIYGVLEDGQRVRVE